MAKRNMSDIIEAYLNQILQEQERIEIQRNEIADRFECVPSQINYVIKTRFTPQRGYVVESKRGGGGYIRIIKLNLTESSDNYGRMIELIGDEISYRDAKAIVTELYHGELVTEDVAILILAAVDDDSLGLYKNENQIRASVLTNILLKMKFQ